MNPDIDQSLQHARQLRDQRHWSEAAAAYAKIASVAPDCFDAWYYGGNAALEAEQLEPARHALQQAVLLRPEFAPAWHDLGYTLTRLEDIPAADAALRRAVALQPQHPGVWLDLASLQMAAEDTAAAEASLRQALDFAPDWALAWHNLGYCLYRQRRNDEAIAAYRQALVLAPELPGAWWSLSLALLLKGEFSEGWRLYEWRLRGGSHRLSNDQAISSPAWTGSPIIGKTILLRAEQGFGDSLQFVRYAPLLRQQGAQVLLALPEALLRLADSLPGVTVQSLQHPAAGDCHSLLMSLPYCCRTQLDTIPASVPYLRAPAAAVARWRSRLAELSGLRIGLVWSGDPRKGDLTSYQVDRRRSIPPAMLAGLAEVAGVHWISLQKGEGGRVQPDLPLLDFTAELSDFADTAALIQALDLVLTVDTSVAHLAGAVGAPVWMLSRHDACWRWLQDRQDSPWYPTMRIFTQPQPGDWRSVMDQVESALRRLLRSR